MDESPLVVLERAILVHHALDRIDISHAIGGALALGYHTEEPRATQDIDMNVTAPARDAQTVFRALPDGVEWADDDVRRAMEDDQVRLWWPLRGDQPPIPLDLFFAAHEYHDVVASRTVTVEMLDDRVPILAATDLVVFKALFNRSRDWPDIEAIIRADPPSLDVTEVMAWLERIVGSSAAQLERLDRLVSGMRSGTDIPTAREIFRGQGER